MSEIRVAVIVDDKGTTAALTKEATLAQKALKGAADAANITGKAVNAARAGVAASSKGMTPSAARAESQDYGKQRAIAGGTGAEGRDFAKQSQGLGGLVHVYATFAANLFAVSAAFGALSRAADTTNMVKGLDQLGVSSGRALGSLSKQLVMVTDGALSLRDAMTATAQASAGGMTNDAILRMGNVAKQASQALGVAMPDAMSRLSRGITKLEPELLDEIGIMVRVDRASQAYALTIGKTANSLTDFEKRQGFANAVLEQGEKKFGAIKIDANPYAKILASMENIAQVGLELINKVFGPLLSILSSSPVALAAAMGAVATVLLKQALPALGMVKDNMAQAAEAAKQLALTKATEAGKGYASEYAAKQASLHKEAQLVRVAAITQAKERARIAIAAADDVAEASVESLVKVENKIKSMTGKGIGKGFANILNKNLDEITDRDLAKMESSARVSDTKGHTEAAVQQRQAILGIVEARTAQADFEKKAAIAKITLDNETIASTKAIDAADRLHAENALKIDKASQEYAANALRNQKGLSQAKMVQVAADRALTNSVLQSISAQAVASTSTKGFGVSMKEAYASVSELRKGRAYIEELNEATGVVTKTMVQSGNIMTGSWTMVKTVISGATAALSNMLNFMAPWLAVIGLAVTGIMAFSAWMSTATKEIDVFDASLGAVKDTTKLLKDVSTDLWSKSSNEWLTAESINARATAMVGFSDGINTILKDLKKVRIASSGWDNFWDGILWTDSRTQKASKAVGEGITEALKTAPSSEAKKAYESKLLEILGGNDLKKLVNLDVSEETLVKLGAASKEFSRVQSNNAEAASGGVKSLIDLDKAYNTLKISMTPGDNLFKFGTSLLDVSKAMRMLGKDTEATFQELLRISKTPADAAKFSIGAALVTQSDTLEKINNQYVTQAKALEVLIATEKKQVSPRKRAMLDLSPESSTEKKIRTVDSVETANNIKVLEASQAKLNEQKLNFTRQVTSMELEAMKSGLAILATGFNNIIQTAQLKFESIVAGALVGEAGIKERERIAIEEIKVRLQANTLASKQILAQEQNTIRLETLTLQLTIAAAEAKLADAKKEGLSSGEISKLIANLDKLNASKNVLVSAAAIISGGSTFKKYSKATQGTEEDKLAADRARPVALIMASAEAQAGAAGVEIKGAKLKGALETISDRTAVATKNITDNITKLDNSIKSLTIANSVSTSMYFQDLIDAKELEKIAQQRKLIETDAKGIIARQTVLMAESPKQAASILKSTTREIVDLSKKNDLQEESNNLTLLRLASDRVSKSYAIEALNTAKAQAKVERDLADKTSILDSEKSRLDVYKAIGLVSEENYLKEKALLDVKAAQLSKAQELNVLENSKKSALSEAGKNVTIGLSAIQEGTGSEEEKANNKAILAKQYSSIVDEINAKEAAGVLISDRKLLSSTEAIKLQSEYNIMLATQNEQMSIMSSLTENLATVFGELGSKIGNAGKAILNMAKQEETYLFKKKKLTEDIEKSKPDVNDDVKDIKLKAAISSKSEKELAKLETKRKTDELDSISEIAGSFKDMFDKKTVAHKAFAAIEKVTAVASMAMKMQQMAVDLVTLGPKIASGVASLFSQGGWAGFAGAAAFLALMGSLGGGSSGSMPKVGFSAADMQETQGTGQKWVDGKKVDTGSGVFGDSSAKSESINNSLEILRDNSIEGMASDKGMIRLLESIDKGIETTAIALFQIQGISSGSGFGTVEGTSSSPGNAGLLGLLGMFNKSSSTEIINSGIKFDGSFKDMQTGGKGSIQQFETSSKTKTSSGLFGLFASTKTEIINSVKDLDSTASKSLRETFDHIGNFFVAQGKRLGMSVDDVNTALATVDVSQFASLKGLKGKELRDELGYIISGIQDDAATKLFPALIKFRKFGEGMSETVTRVLDGSDKVNFGLSTIGVKLGTFSDILEGLNVSEALITAAGGLDKFLEKISFFSDTFLTEAERLKPVSVSLATTLASFGQVGIVGEQQFSSYFMTMRKLGITSIETRDQFKSVVQGLDLTTESGRSMYTSLMDLAPAFDKVAQAVEGIQAVIDGVIESVADSKFGMQYGLKDNEGKYGMLDTKADEIDKKLKATDDIYAIGKLADEQIALINQAWGLLDPEQQKNSLSKYEAKLDEIEDYVILKGATAIDVARSRDKETAAVIAAAVKIAVDEGLKDAAAKMLLAAEKIKEAADTPAVVDLTVTAPARSEVSISQNSGNNTSPW